MIQRKKLKRIRSLSQKKFRVEYGLFLIEGVRLVEEALSAHADIVEIWHTKELGASERGSRFLRDLDSRSVQHVQTDILNLKQISHTVHGQGIVAAVRTAEQADLEEGKNDNWLFLDEIRDPGNMGTILRTADWFALKHVALSKKCVDVYNSKVVRSGMGAHFHLALHESQDLGEIKKLGHTIIAADPQGKPITQIQELSTQSPEKWCLVVGSEAHGISSRIKPLVDHFFSIPGSGRAESLNAAVAAGIMLHRLSTTPSTR